MKKLSALMGLCFVAPFAWQTAHAQTTNVTATSLKMRGVLIPSGTATVTPVNQYGQPIPFAGGDGSQNGVQGYSAAISNGAIVGNFTVPDQALATALTPDTQLHYSVSVLNTATKETYSLDLPPGTLTGPAFALDLYKPTQGVTVASAGLYAGPTAPSHCTVPSLFYLTTAPYTESECVAGVYVPHSDGTGTGTGTGLNYRGTYANANSYAIGDAVVLNGSSYMALQAQAASAAQTPGIATSYWGLLAAAGATGAQGPQGPVGPTGATGATGPQGPAGPSGSGGTGSGSGASFGPPAHWSATTTYALGQTATISGYVWQSTQASNLNNTPSVTSSYWAYAGAAPWDDSRFPEEEFGCPSGQAAYAPNSNPGATTVTLTAVCDSNGNATDLQITRGAQAPFTIGSVTVANVQAAILSLPGCAHKNVSGNYDADWSQALRDGNCPVVTASTLSPVQTTSGSYSTPGTGWASTPAVGDTLVATVNSVSAIGVPAGWTQVLALSTTAAGGFSAQVFSHVVTSNDANLLPASFSSNGPWHYAIVEYAHAGTVSVLASSNSNNGSTPAMALTATPTAANALLTAGAIYYQDTPGSSWTSLYNSGYDYEAVSLSDLSTLTADTTTAQTVTFSNNVYLGYMLQINPAGQ